MNKNVFESKVDEIHLLETSNNLNILSAVLAGGGVTKLNELTIRGMLPPSKVIPSEAVLAAYGEELTMLYKLFHYEPYREYVEGDCSVANVRKYCPPPHMLSLRVTAICNFCRGIVENTHQQPFNPWNVVAQPFNPWNTPPTPPHFQNAGYAEPAYMPKSAPNPFENKKP